MKHYWINIDKCIDRKEFMENQFKQKNIDNLRISAETPETIINYNIIRNEESINTTTPEEISCILSHLKAIEKGYNDGGSYFCILEDDLNFGNIDFRKILNYVEEAQKKNNENVEILQLYTSGHPVVIQLYNEHFSIA
jgi:GR25 family glycosyltransferase involved in LPS biosynthesis